MNKQQEEKMEELQEMMCDRYCRYSAQLISQEELDKHCDSCEMIKLWNFINNKTEEE